MQTVKVKNMVTSSFGDPTLEYMVPYHGTAESEEYGIKHSTPISLQHILCIILYCDTNELQSHFSATFRKQHAFESIDNLKKRHQSYYHFAKRFVEAVHCWGIYNKGPFYCGLNQTLHLTQFHILFSAPLSTSIDVEVAINFADEDGMIMEIQNDTYYAKEQNMFDCSWISRYSEENERLFVANGKRVRIESITIIDTAKQYTLFCNSLWILDLILHGDLDLDDDDPLPHNEIDNLSALLHYKLGLSKLNMNF